MDIAKFKQKCPEHPQFKVEFLQVDNLNDNKKGQKVFYCSACVEQDQNFKHSNYQLIKHITLSGTDSILSKWPPVNDNKLLSSLIQITKGNEEIEKIEKQIETYFTELKDDIMKQLDLCKKKMIQQAQELPKNKNQILNRYQALSKVKELRSVLLDNATDIHQKEKLYREFVESISSQKDAITQQLTSLLEQYQKQSTIFSEQSALLTKGSILKSINSIDFFEPANIQFDTELVPTNFDIEKDQLEIVKYKNNSYKLINKELRENGVQIISNIVLQDYTKYVFRVEIQMMNQMELCSVGLVKETFIDSENQYDEYLSCILYQKNNAVENYPDFKEGISKLIKGNSFKLSKENIIELRVCIGQQILEVLDFPHYQSKLTLHNEYKDHFIENQGLRLCLGMKFPNNQMILQEAFTVENFD